MTTQSIRSTQSGATSARFADLPDILTPHDVIAFLPIGRNAVYDAIKRHSLKSIRVGQKILITKAALREFLGGSVE
ncbi:MAG TPA: helix-turn-helix domain-containing protein [Candidatus Cybelea sp.]